MASHARKLLQRILYLKEPFTGPSIIQELRFKCSERRLQNVSECPAKVGGYEIISPPVQSYSLLAVGG